MQTYEKNSSRHAMAQLYQALAAQRLNARQKKLTLLHAHYGQQMQQIQSTLRLLQP